MEVILPGIAQRLKPLRKARGLTQVEMAALLHCTDRHYQKIEYPQENLPSTTLIILADLFAVPPLDLQGRAREDEPEDAGAPCDNSGGSGL